MMEIRNAAAAMRAAAMAGRLLNDVVSFFVFTLLDALDVVLCYVYKLADYTLEWEWRPCYCSSSPRDVIAGSGKILVLESGGASKVVSLSSTRLHLEDVSDTLYHRPSRLAEVSRSTVHELRRLKRAHAAARRAAAGGVKPSAAATTLTINATIIQMLQGKMGGGGGGARHLPSHTAPRWSDCACASCNPSTSPTTLFVRADGPNEGGAAAEDVLFIHGFISSSAFWTETVFPNLSAEARARYRLFAVDLLGFGRSPKPGDSLYTLREHVEMIERSVLEPYKVRSFHIVAHSLGSILALALAVKYPGAVKSLTLLAPVIKANPTTYIFK